MAPAFRYRYVDIGTVFTGDLRKRDAQSGADSPSILFSNELACDVGGTCWGPNEPLAIIDHRLPSERQFPSASAAVLHKAKLIREKFAPVDEIVWLVTHSEPDFDAFCSMYLARWLIADSDPGIDWVTQALDPNAWTNPPGAGKIDWLDFDGRGVAAQHRWALLLASYASMLESRRHIPCPRERALRSVLHAALKRGRDYLSETSGATELFEEVRSCLQTQQLNPVYDSVLEGSTNFAPELAMLDREAPAYQRDVQRARMSLVYLPESEAPSPDFFEHPNKVVTADAFTEQQLLLAASFRTATDAIFLRDPECSLFQEWARVDLENSALGMGFEMTALAYSNRRPESAANSSEYVFAIDPMRARGRHLFTVWSRLQTEEFEALGARQQMLRPELATGEPRSRALDSLLSDPWSGGQSRSSTIDTPARGTHVGPPGTRSDLRDDPVGEAVRTELEAPVYATTSPAAGPQFTVFDCAASLNNEDAPPQELAFNAPLRMPPPAPDCFRFSTIGLRSDVPISSDAAGGRLARQVGESLWHTLHPELPGVVPQDFEEHLVVRPDAIGVWGARGIALAQKLAPDSTDASLADSDEVRAFRAVVAFARDIDQLAAEWKSFPELQQRYGDNRRPPKSERLEIASEGETLARRALELQHMLALPNRELLRRFSEAIGFEQLVSRLRELNQAIVERLGHDEAAESKRRLEKRSNESAQLRGETKWLQLLVIGFIALALIRFILRNVELGTGGQETLAWLGGPLVLGFAAWLLQPWRVAGSGARKDTTFKWIWPLALLVWLAAWLAQALRVR